MTQNKRVITFHYTLTDKAGEVIDTSRDSEPFLFLEGSGQIIPGLEKSLSLLNVGDTRKIEVGAADAYGNHEQDLIVDIPKEKLPNEGKVQVGDQFQATGPNDEMLLFRVIEVKDDSAVLDGNHPLAGQDLVFDVEVTAMRDATAEEMAHGHAHGPGGAHHH